MHVRMLPSIIECVRPQRVRPSAMRMQVRDVTGTGEVLKKRVREGTGEFPVDCPLHDTTLRLHYRTRAAAGGKAEPGPWAYDSRAATPDGQPLEVDSGGQVTGRMQAAFFSWEMHTAAVPCVCVAMANSMVALSMQLWGSRPVPAPSCAVARAVAAGCGELPEGLELVLKLMVPGELALANADAAPGGRYGYQGRDDCPAGLAEAVASGSGRVEWEVELVDFEREGFWQVGRAWMEVVASLLFLHSLHQCLRAIGPCSF